MNPPGLAPAWDFTLRTWAGLAIYTMESNPMQSLQRNRTVKALLFLAVAGLSPNAFSQERSQPGRHSTEQQATVAASPSHRGISLPPSTAEELAKQVPTPRPEDVATPEGLVKALHDSVNGPVGPWDPARFRSLFIPNAVIYAYPETDDKGKTRVSIVSPDELIKIFSSVHKQSSWEETNLVTKITKYDKIAMAYYSYVANKDGKPFEYGVSFCEMIFDGKRWWILSDVWNDRQGSRWPADLDASPSSQ